MRENPRDPQEGRISLKCWRCGGPHLRQIFPHGEGCVIPTYNIQGHGAEAIEKWGQESSLGVVATIRSLREELQDCKEENKRLVKDLVEKNQLTTTILQNLADLQR